MRWKRHVACMGAKRNAYKILVGKLEGKKPLGRPQHRLETNIEIDLKETGMRIWIGSIWLRIRISCCK
jgi:hypothetical protein